MKPIQFPVMIDKITKKKDKSLSIALGTPELTPTETSLIFELFGKEVWVAMAETGMKEKDLNIPKEIPRLKDEEISESQRMRRIIYRIWEQKTDKKKTFPDYYKSYMFKLNEMLKDKLD